VDTAYAHGVGEPLRDPALAIRWAYDPLLVVFLVAVALYLRGLRRRRGGGRTIRPWQVAAYLAGMTVLIATLVPPLDTWADELFSLHMVQHLLITLVGIPLVVLGAPYAVILRGLPPAARRRVVLPLARSRWLHRALGALQAPLAALLLYETVMWVWHVPRLYDAALRSSGVHLLEHGCMALAALNLWRAVLDPWPLRSRVPPPARLLVLAGMTVLDVGLAALLSFSAASWYAYGGLPSPAWWPLGRLEDQRLGGLIMWVPGGLVELVALAATFAVWAARESRSPAAVSSYEC